MKPPLVSAYITERKDRKKQGTGLKRKFLPLKSPVSTSVPLVLIQILMLTCVWHSACTANMEHKVLSLPCGFLQAPRYPETQRWLPSCPGNLLGERLEHRPGSGPLSTLDALPQASGATASNELLTCQGFHLTGA